jgi:hypothetical protein
MGIRNLRRRRRTGNRAYAAGLRRQTASDHFLNGTASTSGGRDD